jgi:NTE family protein
MLPAWCTGKTKRNDDMNVHVDPDLAVRKRHLPFETVALVLQGAGALGAYQAGVYEALAEADIIAGNPPPSRVERLREFWTHVTSDGPWSCFDATRSCWAGSDAARNVFNQTSASLALTRGARGP